MGQAGLFQILPYAHEETEARREWLVPYSCSVHFIANSSLGGACPPGGLRAEPGPVLGVLCIQPGDGAGTGSMRLESKSARGFGKVVLHLNKGLSHQCGRDRSPVAPPSAQGHAPALDKAASTAQATGITGQVAR